MRKFAVAALQLELAAGDNVDALEREIRGVKARFPWIDMVVAAELAARGPNVRQAEKLPGPLERRFCRVAKESGIWLVPGTLYERAGKQVFNTASAIDPDGKVVARYRKLYPFLPYERGVANGDQGVVFDVPGVGRFGLSICYDMWFPETTRTLAWMGAEVIIHPSLTNTIDRDVEIAIARASAAANQCYFIDVNCAGRLGFGRSCAFGPGGEALHVAGPGCEIIALEPRPRPGSRGTRTRLERARPDAQELSRQRRPFSRLPRQAHRKGALGRLGALQVPMARAR